MSESSGPVANTITRRQLTKRVGFAFAGFGLLPLLQACGSDGGATDRADAEHVVEMNDQFKFVPNQLTVRAGQTVTWRNVGNLVHTSTSDQRAAQRAEDAKLPAGAEPWDSGLIRRGESWSHIFDVPGEYSYFCMPHEAAGMVGTLIVEA